MNEFRKPWRVCPSCNQLYQNEFAIDIAAEFVSFVRRQYPHDTQKQVEALHKKLYSLGFMFERLQPVQKREAEDSANLLLSLIDRMKGEVSPLPRRYSLFESYAYSVHGRIALDEGTEESARRAVANFEKALKVREVIGDAEDIANAKSNLAYAKSMYVSGNNDEKVLKASQELYDLRVAKWGEEHENTIIAGKNYALRLRKGGTL
jgi:hypothetical protein